MSFAFAPRGIESAPAAASTRTALVTVGLGVYNGERWVSAAIESILSQTFRDFVLLISDNCSTDGTYEICSRYAAQDERIWLVRPPENVGAVENYNRMCRMAVGKYFKYASCNDLCAPDFLLRCVEVLERHEDVVLCCPRTMLLDEQTGAALEYPHGLHLMSDDAVERYRTYVDTVQLNNVEQGLVRLSALRKTPLQLPFVGSDMTLMAELSLQGKFYEAPEPLFFRRQGSRTMSVRRTREELVFFYEPGAKVLLWQQWKRVLAQTRMLGRVQLEARDRFRLALLVLRRWRYALPALLADVREAFRYLGARLRWARTKNN